jgi:peroxin-6
MAKINEIVYFTVTNVEYDVVSTPTSSSGQDLYTGSAVGELGCWIDPNLTRIVQTGVEHARVPDTRRYYELGRATS